MDWYLAYRTDLQVCRDRRWINELREEGRMYGWPGLPFLCLWVVWSSATVLILFLLVLSSCMDGLFISSPSVPPSLAFSLRFIAFHSFHLFAVPVILLVLFPSFFSIQLSVLPFILSFLLCCVAFVSVICFLLIVCLFVWFSLFSLLPGCFVLGSWTRLSPRMMRKMVLTMKNRGGGGRRAWKSEREWPAGSLNCYDFVPLSSPISTKGRYLRFSQNIFVAFLNSVIVPCHLQEGLGKKTRVLLFWKTVQFGDERMTRSSCNFLFCLLLLCPPSFSALLRLHSLLFSLFHPVLFLSLFTYCLASFLSPLSFLSFLSAFCSSPFLSVSAFSPLLLPSSSLSLLSPSVASVLLWLPSSLPSQLFQLSFWFFSLSDHLLPFLSSFCSLLWFLSMSFFLSFSYCLASFLNFLSTYSCLLEPRRISIIANTEEHYEHCQ